MHKLILACAGAGKSTSIVSDALALKPAKKKTLILTYTIDNQKELLNKIKDQSQTPGRNLVVKGWFTFLLEDMIRPYQQCFFSKRISDIYFQSGDPHIFNGRKLLGTGEELDGKLNHRHYLTAKSHKAHTAFLSKLACKVNFETNNKSIKRIFSIYDSIYIDEVQDFVGWDFDVLSAMIEENISPVVCVGDFRQTIYNTHHSRKKPLTSDEKIAKFKQMNVQFIHKSESKRSVQSICTFADLVHAQSYPPTTSKVKIPINEPRDHSGIYAVSEQHIEEYIQKYKPIILRKDRNVRSDLCTKALHFNFGKCKGLGFNRTLIIPTQKHIKFFEGNDSIFDKDETEESRNTLYVLLTRSRYSVAFLYDGKKPLRPEIQMWKP